MTLEELKLRRFAGQHLLAPVDSATKLWQDLKGIGVTA